MLALIELPKKFIGNMHNNVQNNYFAALCLDTSYKKPAARIHYAVTLGISLPIWLIFLELSSASNG